MSNKDIDVRFGSDTRDLKEGTREAKASIDSVEDHVNKLSKSLKGIALGFLSAFSVRAVIDFSRAVGDAAERVDQLSQITGLSSQEVRQWSAIAQTSGKSMEDIASAAGKLELAFTKAAAGSAKEGEAFRNLGVDINNVGSSQEALMQIADRFSKMDDGPRKYALAVALMGKNGKEMIPILNQGSDALRKQMDDATALGAVWGRTNEEQAAFEAQALAVDDAFDKQGLAVGGLGNMLVDTFAPAIIATVNGFTNLVKSMVESYRQGGIVKGIMESLSVTFKVIMSALAILGNLFTAAFRAAVIGAVYAIAAVDGVGQAIKALLAGDWDGAGKAMGKAMGVANSIAAEQNAKARIQAADTRRFIDDLWSKTPRAASPRSGGGGFDISGGTSQPGAGEAAAKAAKEALSAKMEQLAFEQDMVRGNFEKEMALEEEKLALLRGFYGEDSQEYIRELRNKERMLQRHNAEELRWAQEVSRQQAELEVSDQETSRQIQLDKLRDEAAIIDQRLRMGEITERKAVELKRALAEQELQIELTYQDAVYQLRLQALDDQLAMDGLTLDAQRQLNAEKEQLEREHQNKMRIIRSQGDISAAQGSRDASEATVDHWKKILGPVSGTFSQVTHGLITETTSWRDAFLQIGDTLLTQFIGWCTEMGLNWLATELAKTGATTAGAATRTGVEAAASGTSIALSATTALADIGASAARAAAGAYAAIAGIPIVGPFLAPAMAGAALAAVLAMGKSLFSAEGGWGEVPHDGATTTLHRKEMVLPASIASPLRAAIGSGTLGGGGGGGPGGGGGGDTYYISALDGQSVKRVLMKHAKHVVGAGESEARKFRVRTGRNR